MVEGASRTRAAVAGVLSARAVTEGAGAAGCRLGRPTGTRISSGARVTLVVPCTCWIHGVPRLGIHSSLQAKPYFICILMRVRPYTVLKEATVFSGL